MGAGARGAVGRLAVGGWLGWVRPPGRVRVRGRGPGRRGGLRPVDGARVGCVRAHVSRGVRARLGLPALPRPSQVTRTPPATRQGAIGSFGPHVAYKVAVLPSVASPEPSNRHPPAVGARPPARRAESRATGTHPGPHRPPATHGARTHPRPPAASRHPDPACRCEPVAPAGWGCRRSLRLPVNSVRPPPFPGRPLASPPCWNGPGQGWPGGPSAAADAERSAAEWSALEAGRGSATIPRSGRPSGHHEMCVHSRGRRQLRSPLTAPPSRANAPRISPITYSGRRKTSAAVKRSRLRISGHWRSWLKRWMSRRWASRVPW